MLLLFAGTVLVITFTILSSFSLVFRLQLVSALRPSGLHAVLQNPLVVVDEDAERRLRHVSHGLAHLAVGLSRRHARSAHARTHVSHLRGTTSASRFDVQDVYVDPNRVVLHDLDLAILPVSVQQLVVDHVYVVVQQNPRAGVSELGQVHVCVVRVFNLLLVLLVKHVSFRLPRICLQTHELSHFLVQLFCHSEERILEEE